MEKKCITRTTAKYKKKSVYDFFFLGDILFILYKYKNYILYLKQS